MHRNTSLSDGQIVQQVLSGRTEAFAELVERHLSVVRGLAYAQVGNHSDTEDLSQEVFLRAFQSLDALRDTHKFLPWLAGITRNVSRGFQRSRFREKEALQKGAFEEQMTNPDPVTEELHSAVRTQVGRLRREDRDVLLLHYFAGKTTREVAEILGISRHAAKKRLERSRGRLAVAMLEAVGEVVEPRTPAKERRERIMAAVVMCEAPWQGGASSPRTPGTEPVMGIRRLLTGKAAALALAFLASGVFLLWNLPARGYPDAENVSNGSGAPPSNPWTVDTEPSPGLDHTSHTLLPELTLEPPQERKATPEEELGSVTGHVVMAGTERPVPGVEVITSRQLWTAVTDQSGWFQIDRCIPGQHKITVRTVKMGNCVPIGDPVTFSVAPNKETSGVVIGVTREGIVEGILTMDGESLADQRVSVFYEGRTLTMGEFGTHYDPRDKRIWSANVPGGQQWKRTDANGGFRFGGLIGGEVTLIADLEYGEEPNVTSSRLIQTAEVETGSTTRVHLEFAPAEAVIEGRLFLEEVAVEQVGVGAKLVGSSDEDGEIYFADVDADGHYVLDGLPEGTLSVWAYVRASDKTGHVQRNAWVASVPGQAAVQDFDFFREAGIAGYVSNLHSGEEATVVAVEGKLNLEGFIPQSIDDLRNLGPSFEVKVQADGMFFIESAEQVEQTLVVLAILKQTQIENEDAARTRWGTGTAWPSQIGDSSATIVLE
jgi:RNA polymerase sigma factor (sigma-70 family)